MRISNPIAVIGEELACDYLKKKGYKLIERNFRKRYGEIDIIVTKNKKLIFVEVKTRTSNIYGTPIESINIFKLKSLIKTAEYYKYLHPELPEELRIDAISVVLNDFGELRSIEQIENITG